MDHTCSRYSATLANESDKALIHDQGKLMTCLKRDKRPLSATEPDAEVELEVPSIKRRRKNENPAVMLSQLEHSYNINMVEIDSSVRDSVDPWRELENIIIEQRIDKNPEQERAVRIVAEHFINDEDGQLVLHVSGIGGSGKSHVISALVELFRRCGGSRKLLLSAPTGCAAVLIGGYTIHALTFLPQSKWKPDQEQLMRIWHDVKYLIIDEISMVSARLFADISTRMAQAKSVEKPFGGVNMILTGDFGQLRPVKAASLFSHRLVGRIGPDISQKSVGQSALQGASLWRQIQDVVELKQNFRAKEDPEFVNLLSRVRSGCAWNGKDSMTEEQLGTGRNYTISDYDVLRKRQLSVLKEECPETLRSLRDAPIIVARKSVRDALNLCKVKSFAKSTNQECHWYHSRDKFHRQSLSGHQQQLMWRVRSSVTNDSIGMLPLVPGMKVMVTENVALKVNVVNGAEGILEHVKYETDELGRRYALCAYVRIKNSGIQSEQLQSDVIPILPVMSNFRYSQRGGLSFNIQRSQLPLVPAYAFTDYKVQGRSMDKAVMDLSSCYSLQSAYVMLSRAKSLAGVGILKWFPPSRINTRLSQEFRDEFARLKRLDRETKIRFDQRTTDESQY